ncbi:MAG: hypothetical protein IPG23_08625 [Burkholderiales bacterium]|jgi:hypothetical protein|nr:hypothetical protein [Burkholderiales bacterium]
MALIDAVAALATPAKGPTFRELINFAQVGKIAARHTVPKLVRCGVLTIARTRRVTYRNRPVAEYALAQRPTEQTAAAGVDLAAALAHWR